MFSLTSSDRFYLYQHYIHMGKGIDGLYNLIRSEMPWLSPISGDCFVFFSKNRQSAKILKWDTDGFLLFHKRLERGSFEVPAFNPQTGDYEISWKTFSLIMEGISLRSVRFRKRLQL